ncbi:hypothetical protein A8144_01000 [Mycobacterium leprae 3125609]|uniref:PPE domain-containing protein n=1 Tax=Mycobacterium leprae TaxID=1769 RepID=UPI000674CBB4|nr:hypothetical protein A8144_01000 [Mycobacterium leprae 3125609]OAX72338.1 hypothetical protein A3216_01080 [Mycobacterium leprae 7935681]
MLEAVDDVNRSTGVLHYSVGHHHAAAAKAPASSADADPVWCTHLTSGHRHSPNRFAPSRSGRYLMDFATLPPEINSPRMYADPGSGPMMAAVAVWDELATELHSAVASYVTVTAALAGVRRGKADSISITSVVSVDK